MPTNNNKNIIIQLVHNEKKNYRVPITIRSMYFTNNQLGGGSYTLIMQSYSNNDMKKVGMPSS